MSNKVEKHRVFLAARDVSGGHIFALEHPRLGSSSPMQIMRTPDALLEVQRWSADENYPRSWLVAGMERVQQDGSFFLATPVHPALLLLPRLRAARGAGADNERGYFRPLSDVAGGGADQAAVEAHVMSLPNILSTLRLVCDVNDKYDEPMVRLNDAKLLAWLQRMTEAVRTHISSDKAELAAAEASKKATDMGQFADNVAFENGVLPGARVEAPGLHVALAFVCEYLPMEVQRSLCEAVVVPVDAIAAQRGLPKAAPVPEAPAPFGSSASAGNRSRDEPEAPAAKKPKPAGQAKAASLAKLPLKKGQTTMMGFFKK